MSSTNRVCALIVRLCLDTNMVLLLLYRYLPQEEADEIMKRVHRMAISRLRNKLSPDELDVRKMIDAPPPPQEHAQPEPGQQEQPEQDDRQSQLPRPQAHSLPQAPGQQTQVQS
jgi:hypothetical protein